MRPATILIIDDDETVLRFVLRALEKLGFNVLTASNGPEALLLCEEHEGDIDIVLADVILPGLKGAELRAYLRSKRPNARLIFMSGFPEDILEEHGVARKDVDFLDKPLTVTRLESKLEQVLNGSSS